MARRKDPAAPSGEAKAAVDGGEPRPGDEPEVAKAATEAAPIHEATSAPAIRLAASDTTADNRPGSAEEPAGTDEVTLRAPRPDILGPALSPLERARRNPLLNWLNRRVAVIALAAGIGALVGTTASNGIGYVVASATGSRVDQTEALRASVSQLAAEIAALKTTVATGGRAQAEIAGLAQFRQNVSGEITGSVGPAGPPADGWTLLRVANGRALVKGDAGSFEVIPGTTLPGLGMVQRIMQQDGMWVVKTRGGLIRSGG